MTRDIPATVRGGRRRHPRTPAGAGRGLEGGTDCVGGCWGRFYVVGYRDAGAGPLPPTPVVLASCQSRGEALALRARFRRQLPQYAGVGVERAGCKL